MPEEFYDIDFPNLRREGWQRTSEPAAYNCIAFAVGETSKYWWPNPAFPDPCDDYWPTGVPNEESIDAFVQALATVGFVLCDSGDPEQGYQKIVLYELNGAPTHAAVLQENGNWRSKLGRHEDIETTLAGLVGPCYGDVAHFLKRKH